MCNLDCFVINDLLGVDLSADGAYNTQPEPSQFTEEGRIPSTCITQYLALGFDTPPLEWRTGAPDLAPADDRGWPQDRGRLRRNPGGSLPQGFVLTGVRWIFRVCGLSPQT